MTMSKIIIAGLLLGCYTAMDAVNGQGRLLQPASRLSMWRKGYIAQTHEDDAESGCITSKDEMCPECGESINFAGDAVKNYGDGGIVKIVLQFIREDYFTTNYLRVCPFDDVTEECFGMHPLLTSIGDEAFNITTTKEEQEIKLIFTLPVNLTCSRCVLEWKYRSEFNATHDWEGRHCADIAIDHDDSDMDYNKVPNEDDDESYSDEYSNDGLFAIYVDETDVVVFEDVDKNNKLVNDYKPDSNSSKMEPKAMPYKTDMAISRQMDIPLTEEGLELDVLKIPSKNEMISSTSATTAKFTSKSSTTTTTRKATTSRDPYEIST